MLSKCITLITKSITNNNYKENKCVFRFLLNDAMLVLNFLLSMGDQSGS